MDSSVFLIESRLRSLTKETEDEFDLIKVTTVGISVSLFESGSNFELPKWRKTLVLCVILLFNVLIGFDNSMTGSLLPIISGYYKLSSTEGGLLKTVYVVGVVFGAPLWGSLSNKFPRKWLLFVGLSIWSAAVVCQTFGSGEFGLLVLEIGRFLAGFGVCVSSALSASILADIFSAKTRPIIIILLVLAWIFGSVLAYGGSTAVSTAMEDFWGREGFKWALNLPGILSWPLLAVTALFFPGLKVERNVKVSEEKSRWYDDLDYLIKNKTFMKILVAGFFTDFAGYSFSYWFPSMMSAATAQDPSLNLALDYPFILSIEILLAGILGAIVTLEIGRQLKNRYGIFNGQLVIAGLSGIFAWTLKYFTQEFVFTNVTLAWVALFLSLFATSASLAVVPEVAMATNPSFVRPVASSVQSVACNIFGDGIAPMIVGAVSDFLMKGKPDTFQNRFLCYKEACTVPLVLGTIGACIFLFASRTYEEDVKKADRLNNLETFEEERKSRGGTFQRLRYGRMQSFWESIDRLTDARPSWASSKYGSIQDRASRMSGILEEASVVIDEEVIENDKSK